MLQLWQRNQLNDVEIDDLKQQLQKMAEKDREMIHLPLGKLHNIYWKTTEIMVQFTYIMQKIKWKYLYEAKNKLLFTVNLINERDSSRLCVRSCFIYQIFLLWSRNFSQNEDFRRKCAGRAAKQREIRMSGGGLWIVTKTKKNDIIAACTVPKAHDG